MNAIKKFFEDRSAASRLGLIAALLLLALATAGALWWALAPRHGLLFTDLGESDAAEIAQSLREWKVPYQYSADGRGIEVGQDQVYDLRMRLVSAGIPRGGHVGFELFDDADFGATEFAQRINFQRALQGEIERTIAALPGVANARVHLNIRRPGLFVSDQDASKASVALSLQPGTVLDGKQIGGIRHLVASAVEGLSPDAVVVLGDNGALLAGAGNGASGHALSNQIEEQSEYEARIRDRVVDLLRGVFGFDDFRISVDAQLNFDTVHRVSERVLPFREKESGLLVRKQNSRSGSGETSNTQEQLEYAHGKEREEIARAPGRIERLSLAVLVPPTLTAPEMERLRKLIAAAAGLDGTRGDTLELSTFPELPTALEADREPAVASTNPASAAALPDPHFGAQPQAPVIAPSWLLAAALGLVLLGLLLGIWLRPRQRPLTADERAAMTEKLKSWLAEGTGSA